LTSLGSIQACAVSCSLNEDCTDISTTVYNHIYNVMGNIKNSSSFQTTAKGFESRFSFFLHKSTKKYATSKNKIIYPA